MQIENGNKFSSVGEAKCYTGFIFKLLRARDYMLYAIFYQFEFESSHHHHHHHQHLHHYQYRIVIIIKRILFDLPSTNNLSFFLPGERYHVKARLTLM